MEKLHPKYIFVAIFIVIALLAFLVIRPFITAILASIVLAYLFHPFYKKLSSKINKTLAALIILVIVILLFVLPTVFVVESLFKQSLDFYYTIQSYQLTPVLQNIFDKVSVFVTNEAQSLITSIPRFLMNSFVTLFLFYYFLREGDKIVNNVKKIIPLEKKHKEVVFNEFERVSSAVVYGLILIGLIVGVLGTIGFYIFNVPNPILWGFILIIVSMLPGLGNAVIWIPAAFVKFLQGDYFNAIGLFIYGAIFISGVELFFKPKLISQRSQLHPGIIVLGVFGGIALLGFIGVFFGPLILVIFITLLKHFVDKH